MYICTVRSINIGTQFSFFWLYTPPQWIWNETKRVFTSKSGEWCRNYNSFYMCLPLFKGPKVMGQLAAQLFHGQVFVILSLSHLQGADQRSRVHFKCAICSICCCQLSIWDPKSCHYQWSKPSLGWKIKTNRSERWNILKKKECTGELSNTKRPGRPRKTTVMDERAQTKHEVKGIVCRPPRQDCLEEQIWGSVQKHFCCFEGPNEHSGLHHL